MASNAKPRQTRNSRETDVSTMNFRSTDAKTPTRKGRKSRSPASRRKSPSPRRVRTAPRGPLPALSVVLPLVGGDPAAEWADAIRQRVAEVPGVELIVGAGATRAERLQRGIEAARGRVVLCHHPRSLVTAEGLRWLRDHAAEVSWGGFTHAFDASSLLLRYTSWYSNAVRPRHGVVYLDHCIFFRRELLTRPIPDVAIFEDTELSKILAESGKPTILPFTSTTSAVRFLKNGVARQLLLNQVLKVKYLLGAGDGAMNAAYEKGLHLNDPGNDPAAAAAAAARREAGHGGLTRARVWLAWLVVVVAVCAWAVGSGAAGRRALGLAE